MTTESSADLWLERSRLDGIVLAAFTYGIFFILTLQAGQSIIQAMRSRIAPLQSRMGYILLGYVIITFILGSIGMGVNARYTEDIWINFRGEGRTPVDLIVNEFEFWHNRMAADSQLILLWILDSLLLYRCVVVWNYNVWVTVIMGSFFLIIVGISTSTMVLAGKSAVFMSLRMQTAFLAISAAYNVLFTFLICVQLFIARRRMKNALGTDHLGPYTSMTATIIESTSLYLVVELIYLFAYAFHDNIQNLILMENVIVQAISQLMLILHVAKGRDNSAMSANFFNGGDRNGRRFRSNPSVLRRRVRVEEDSSRAYPETFEIDVISNMAHSSTDKEIRDATDAAEEV